MNHKDAVINEIRHIPVITAYNSIGPYLEFRRKDTDEVVSDLFSINAETGAALFPKRVEGGGFESDDNGEVVMVERILDLRLYYMTFKPLEPVKKTKP